MCVYKIRPRSHEIKKMVKQNRERDDNVKLEITHKFMEKKKKKRKKICCQPSSLHTSLEACALCHFIFNTHPYNGEIIHSSHCIVHMVLSTNANK